MITTHKTPENFYTVTENGIWIPGIYETEEVAKKAVSMSNKEIEFLLGPIYRIDGLDRPVNADDMFLALEATQELRWKKYVGDFAPEMENAGE